MRHIMKYSKDYLIYMRDCISAVETRKDKKVITRRKKAIKLLKEYNNKKRGV